MTETAARRDPVEELAEEFMARLRRGERPSPSEYAAAHPELADDIRDLFPALVVLEDVKPAGTAPPGPAVGAAVPPGRLGDYRILREVARGGMGVVYEAEQVALGRHVALKVLPAQPGKDALRLLRFRREARAAARLHHTNIVPVFDVGCADGVHYYAMQFIQGQGLDEVLRELRRLRAGDEPTGAPAADLTVTLADGLRTGVFAAAPIVPGAGPAPPEPSDILSGPVAHYHRSVAGLGVQAADALAYAHGQRVLHRDVKPSNLLLDCRGTLWLTDFGLAKDDGDDLTRTGDVVGTLRYMAPERFRGVSDPQADVYALGITLYELLTLRPAFHEADRVRLVERIAHDDPPRPRLIDPAVPRDLETVVLKAIEKDPDRRYASAAALADDLRRFLADRPIAARRASWREQGWRWCRRNPGVAASVASAGLFLALLVAGLSVGYARVSRAKGEAVAALAEEMQAAYFQRVALADRELAANNLARAEGLLAACPPELRRWEWDYLNRSRGRPPALLRHPHPVSGKSALSPDGRTLATAGRHGAVTLFDLAGGARRTFTPPGAGGCWAVAFRPDGRVLATVGSGRVWFHDPVTLAEVRPAWGFGDRYPQAVAYSPDGEWVAVSLCRTAERRVEVQVREAATGRVLASLGTHAETAQGLAFSPDGRLVASAGGDRVVRVSDAATGRVAWEARDDRPVRHVYWCLAFRPDGTRLAAGFAGENEREPGGVRVWEVAGGREGQPLTGHDVHALAWGPDGRLATGGNDRTVRVWDPNRGVELLILRGHTDIVGGVAFTPDGHKLVSTAEDRLVRVWDATPVAAGEHVGDELATLTGHTNGAKALAFRPDGAALVSGGSDGRVLVWNPRDWAAAPRELAAGLDDVHALAYGPGGDRLAVGGKPAGRSAVFDARTGGRLAALEPVPGTWPHRLAFAPGPGLLAGVEQNGGVQVWDAAGRVRRLAGAPPWVYGVAVAPGPRPLVAVASSAGGVRVYDPATAATVAALDHPAAAAVAFSPDGTRLASAGWDDVVRVWRAADWALTDQYRDPGGGANSLAFSPDGRLLAWGGTDAAVKVWRVGAGPAAVLRGHRHWVWDVAFAPAGDVLASAGRDGTVKVWRVPDPPGP